MQLHYDGADVREGEGSGEGVGEGIGESRGGSSWLVSEQLESHLIDGLPC